MRKAGRLPSWLWSHSSLSLLGRAAYAWVRSAPGSHLSGLMQADPARLAAALRVAPAQGREALEELAKTPGLDGRPLAWWCSSCRVLWAPHALDHMPKTIARAHVVSLSRRVRQIPFALCAVTVRLLDVAPWPEVVLEEWSADRVGVLCCLSAGDPEEPARQAMDRREAQRQLSRAWSAALERAGYLPGQRTPELCFELAGAEDPAILIPLLRTGQQPSVRPGPRKAIRLAQQMVSTGKLEPPESRGEGDARYWLSSPAAFKAVAELEC